MSLQINCPGCSTKLAVPNEMLGKQIKCPKCQKLLALSAPKSASPAKPAAPAAAQATLTLGCPCGKKLKVPTTSRGKRVRCPGCQKLLQVPGGPGGTPTATPAPSAAPLPSANPIPAAPLAAPLAAAPADPFGTDPLGGVPNAAPLGGVPAADPFGTAQPTPMGAPAADPFGDIGPIVPAGAAAPAAGGFPAYTPPPSAPIGSPGNDHAALAAAGAYQPSLDEKMGAVAAAQHPSSRDWGEFFGNRIHIFIFLMLLGGPVVAFFGWQAQQKMSRLKSVGVTVDGVILEGEERRGRKGSRSYKFTVMYSTEDGQVLTDEFSVKGNYFREHIAGDEINDAPVQVLYNPKDPKEAIIVGGSTDASLSLWIGLVAFILGICGTVYIVFVGDIDF